MDPIQQITTSLVDRSVGLDLLRTAPAIRISRPAESAAPAAPADRSVFQTLPAGQIPAVAPGMAFTEPARMAFGAPSVHAGGTVPSPASRPLGEDLAWIVLKDKTPVELAGYVQDPAVLALAEMALLDPGRRRLEHAVREWVGLDAPPQAAPTGTEVELFKLGLGAKVSGFGKTQLAIEPEVDLIKIRSPRFDDLSLSAGFPINLAGQVHLRAQLQWQKGLDPEADRALDSHIRFDSQDQELNFRLGLRQRLGRDESVSLYAQQTTPFDNRPLDLGVGVYLAKQWH